MLEIVPTVSVGGVAFGATRETVEARWGSPQSVTAGRTGEVILRYPNLQLTLDAAGLAEVGVSPEADPVVMDMRPLSARSDFDRLVKQDGRPMEFLGFVVLENLGVAITGVHDGDDSQRALTAFREGRWAPLRDQMKPFSVKARGLWKLFGRS